MQDKSHFMANFLRRCGSKVARFSANLALLTLAIFFYSLLSDEIFDYHEPDSISSNVGSEFVDHVKIVIQQKLEMLPKTVEGKYLVLMSMNVLTAARALYENGKAVSMELFTSSEISSIVVERLLKSANHQDTLKKLRKEK